MNKAQEYLAKKAELEELKKKAEPMDGRGAGVSKDAKTRAEPMDGRGAGVSKDAKTRAEPADGRDAGGGRDTEVAPKAGTHAG